MYEIQVQESEAVSLGTTIRPDELAKVVMDGLKEYAQLATEDLKESVKEAAKVTKKEIADTAPKDTGAYRKSWTTKKTKETANSLEITVHSKKRYRLTHLLEFGHAKRGGGRVAAKPHIAPAEEKGIKALEKEIERKLGG